MSPTFPSRFGIRRLALAERQQTARTLRTVSPQPSRLGAPYRPGELPAALSRVSPGERARGPSAKSPPFSVALSAFLRGVHRALLPIGVMAGSVVLVVISPFDYTGCSLAFHPLAILSEKNWEETKKVRKMLEA